LKKKKENKKMIIKKRWLVLSLVVIVIGALVFFFVLKKKPEKQAEESGSPQTGAPAQKAEEAPRPVKVALARKGELIIRLKSPGEAVTERRIALKAEVAGVIKKLNVEEGQHVKKGDLMVELDDQEYRLKLERQEALRLSALSSLFLENQFASPGSGQNSPDQDKLKRAKEEFNKAESLFNKGLASGADFEKAQKDYELVLIETGMKKSEIMAASKGLTQAEVDVKIARMELEKTKIRAPFFGIVTGIKVSPEEHIETGRELFTLVDISQIKVLAKVLESEIGKMKVGREVDLRFSAYPQKVFRGKVAAVSPVINPEDRTCAVHIMVENPQEEIKPGMHAEVEIAADVYKDRLLVPQEAVLVRGGRKLVFVVEEGLAKWRYIEVGLENEQYAEVLDGVKLGEKVIIEGHFTLAHDARVSVVE
jgi:RND family efflux transporter MFP subunit